MNLILFQPDEFDGATRLATLSPRDPRAIHVQKVLHLVPGQFLRAGLLDGPSGTATLLPSPSGASNVHPLQFQCSFDTPIAPLPRIDLLLALPRPKVFHRLLEDLAALSFGTLWAFPAQKTRSAYAPSHHFDAESIRDALLSGLQQSRRTRLPAVQFLPTLDLSALPLPTYALRLLAHPMSAPTHGVFHALPHLPAAGRILVAIGPEPGWTGNELRRLLARHFIPLSLGPTPLRTPTASIALLSALHLGLAAKPEGFQKF